MHEYLWVDSQYQPPVVDLNFFTLTHSVTMSDRVYLQSVSSIFFFHCHQNTGYQSFLLLPTPADIVPCVPGQGLPSLETIRGEDLIDFLSTSPWLRKRTRTVWAKNYVRVLRERKENPTEYLIWRVYDKGKRYKKKRKQFNILGKTKGTSRNKMLSSIPAMRYSRDWLTLLFL